jgi:hypothetical protein
MRYIFTPINSFSEAGFCISVGSLGTLLYTFDSLYVDKSIYSKIKALIYLGFLAVSAHNTIVYALEDEASSSFDFYAGVELIGEELTHADNI